jgi:hypothetical protein
MMDLSNWEPDFDKRKKKRDREFELKMYQESHQDRILAAKELEELKAIQKERRENILRRQRERYIQLKKQNDEANDGIGNPATR